MRPYPRNSPEAAGRILALVLLCDGHVCISEIDSLRCVGAEDRLGLSPGGLGVLLRELSEDLLMGARSCGSLLAAIDAESLRAVMREVTHPILRSEVLTLAQAAAQADRHLAAGERYVLDAARRHWLGGPELPAEREREPLAA